MKPGNWTVAVDFQAELGEGLHWDPRGGVLWFVDIHGRRIARWDPGHVHHDEWPTPERCGWVIPLADGTGSLAGFEHGVARLSAQVPMYAGWAVQLFESDTGMRLNDAKADGAGSVWFGTMSMAEPAAPVGALHRLDVATGRVETVDGGYRIPNGPAISPDGRELLHTDSARRSIHAFRLDTAGPALTDKRLWRRFEAADGFPDGMTFDSEGCLWVAHWGAGAVCRYSPDGQQIRKVALPATQVSNVCFGGPALDRLFVTSARTGLSAAERAEQPLAGALFEIDAGGVRGLPGLAAG